MKYDVVIVTKHVESKEQNNINIINNNTLMCEQTYGEQVSTFEQVNQVE